MDLKPAETFEVLINRLRNDIFPLLKKAVGENDISLLNPDVAKCWKLMDCNSNDCVMYGNELDMARYWQASGTACDKDILEDPAQDYAKDSSCNAFKNLLPAMINEIDKHFNSLLFLLEDQKAQLLEKDQQIMQVNKKLSSTKKQLNMKNKKLQELLITDKLTGLFNRQHLATVLEDEIAHCRKYGYPVAIIMIGIDEFKDFNNRYGSTAGDRMLAYAGSLIKKNFRKLDRAFRYSDKEFLIILPETDLTLAYIASERLRNGFKDNTFKVNSKESFSGTISIGITTVFPHITNNSNIETMIGQAEKALSSARDSGGNTSVRYE